MSDVIETAGSDGGKRRPLLGRIVRATLYVKLTLALLIGLATGIVYLRLSAGPVSVQGMEGRVAEALAERIGPGWHVRLNDAAIELNGWTPALRASGIDIRNPDGVLVVRAPYAIVSIDPLSLTTGSLVPRSIELQDLRLRASIADDGSLSFEPALDEAEAARARIAAGKPPVAPPVSKGPAPSKLSAAVASLFNLAFESTSIVAALDSARITGASLTLIDSDKRERVAFSRVNADFDRVSEKRRRFALELEGPRGLWRIGGDVGTATGSDARSGSVTIRNLPVQDLLLLTGLSRIPAAAAEMTLSADISASLANGQLASLKGSVHTSPGIITVDDPDTPPIAVDAIAAEASWNEEQRVMALDGLSFQGGDNRIKLDGTLALDAARQGWALALGGRDVIVSGAGEQDRPFTIGQVEAEIGFADGGVLLNRLALTGDRLGLTVSGSYGTNADKGGLRAAVDARGTDARQLLRLWPAAMAAEVRRYLVANTEAGRVEKLGLVASLSAADVRDGFRGEPLPDKAFEVEFALNDVSLRPVAGLPPLQKSRATGVATGRTVAVRVASAVVPDGKRALTLSEGSFRMTDIPSGAAQVGFRLEGGADAFASVMQSPMIRKSAAIDLDPALVKGNVNLRVDFPVSFKDQAEVSDIPISAKGVLTDVVVEKAFGRERLEAASLAMAYDKAGLSLKGDVKLSGLPGNLELRQPKGGPGEAAISLVLDEAARTKRGLGFAGAINGPVSVKAAVPLPKTERAGVLVEVDFGKASFENLLPGWSKTAGKAGTATFVLKEMDASTELTELVVDSTPVLIKGSVSIPENGAERVDFSTFKISPGDEMRVQGERVGGLLKVQARGNVADARSMLRQMTAGGSGGKPARDSLDLDLDLSANILAGFNDEALTGATVKLSMRNRELRQLQMQGRFRSAPVSAQVTQRDRAPPVLTLRSGDAGATLRFIDLYRRMIGGTLNLQASLEGASQIGGIEIDSFELRSEPALKSIISQQPSGTGSEERGNAQLSKLDVDEVHFTKLRTDFSRSASRLDVKDAVIWGPQVGFKLAGFLDYGRDRADISGTFVPAYGLNNVFSQVPVFGMILGGGQNEGLFAINFRIHGAPSAPTLVVNPLSAVAPGIFRKLFGAGGPSETTGTTSPLLPEK